MKQDVKGSWGATICACDIIRPYALLVWQPYIIEGLQGTIEGMERQRLSLREVNGLGQQEFVSVLGFLFEGSPWIASEAWHALPFGNLEELQAALCGVMYSADASRKVALIEAHPDLVGKAAFAGTLAPASASEQASAGLDKLSDDEIATFRRLNSAYRDKFGFPFVICARENKKESILACFETRLQNSREVEIEMALREIAKIAHLRLVDTVSPD